MKFDGYFQLGTVKAAHGIKGVLKCVIDSNFPEKYSTMQHFYLSVRQQLQQYKIENCDVLPSGLALIKLKEINDRNAALQLCGLSFYLEESFLEDLSDQEQNFYYHEVIGYSVVDAKLGNIGVIKDILDMPAQDVLVIEQKGKEILIPLIDPFLKGIKRTEKVLALDLPEGLVEIYTNDNYEVQVD